MQRKQQATKGEPALATPQSSAAGKAKANPSKKAANTTAKGANNVALSPQAVAAQAAALAAALASTEASVQALSFYRIPLFLLPIYKAAAVQYGVPWQILAAINEIETDYGNDLSVSSAGAVGWMQFMPSTWLQYGVDALNAGYADPLNPVDAVFAAARYLRAAGAEHDLRSAIFAYNHSEEYVDSVLLRARLISAYPKGVIATLTGLVDGRLPVTGASVSWNSALPASSSATANAVLGESGNTSEAAAGTSAPNAATAPTPSAAAAKAAGKASTTAAKAELDDVSAAAGASVVAVQDGRIAKIGSSPKLGKYVVLRDVYGDLFTYSQLGSIAPTYKLPKPQKSSVTSPALEAASTHAPTPSQPASAGAQSPVTLHVKTPSVNTQHTGSASVEANAGEAVSGGKVRLFAKPGNPDAKAAVASAAKLPRHNATGRALLRKGSVVSAGTILGRVKTSPGSPEGHLHFSIQPAGDTATIDPGPILANWAQLAAALHPHGAKAENPLLGATASDVLLMDQAQLERTVLADPGVTMDACARHEVAAGKVDKRLLAVVAFLSRSGLKPTLGAIHCGSSAGAGTASGSAQAAESAGEELAITAVNGVAVAGHQGAGTITDLTIRSLLSLPTQFVPHEIVSLMRYPGNSDTRAASAYWNRIELVFTPATTAATHAKAPLTPAAAARAARAAKATSAGTPYVSAGDWNQLIGRIGALPAPLVSTKQSSYAVADPKKR